MNRYDWSMLKLSYLLVDYKQNVVIDLENVDLVKKSIELKRITDKIEYAL